MRHLDGLGCPSIRAGQDDYLDSRGARALREVKKLKVHSVNNRWNGHIPVQASSQTLGRHWTQIIQFVLQQNAKGLNKSTTPSVGLKKQVEAL